MISSDVISLASVRATEPWQIICLHRVSQIRRHMP
jgi:hypothetical protein